MNPCRLWIQLSEPCYFSANLMGRLSLISSAWYCLGLALMSTVLLQLHGTPHEAEKTQRENTGLHNGILTWCENIILSGFHYKTAAEEEKQNSSVAWQLQACGGFYNMWHLRTCVLHWRCSLARCYRSLIQNYSIAYMHAPVAANTGELNRACQPHCDTEHDNVCYLLGAACLPACLRFNSWTSESACSASNRLLS